jgi:hypothetical protein
MPSQISRATTFAPSALVLGSNTANSSPMFDHFAQQPLSEGFLPQLFFDLLAFDRVMDCPHQQLSVKSSL